MPLSVNDLPEVSMFVKRALMGALPMADDAERLSWLQQLSETPYTRERIEAALEGFEDSETLLPRLRVLRREVMLTLVARDAMKKADYFEVVRTMTDLAEVAVSRVVRCFSLELASRFGIPTSESGVPQDLLVVGMGKLGGEELNVSSDIDLIFVFDEPGQCRAWSGCPSPRRQLTNAEFFERLSKKVIPALSEIEGAGFVFRVDMRLRPNGDSGPICVSNEMLEEYLYVQGREWERFAWLKSRVVNTAVFADEEVFAQQVKNLNDVVRPFVFRKYVDFNAISALSNLHRLIRAETVRREAGKDLGIDVKLGRGGIREIEFITQTFQVIRAGREPALRGKNTLKMLPMLAKYGVIKPEQAEALSNAYIFLRNLEHAIQYVDDQQTHRLPVDAEGLNRVARLLGISAEQLTERLSGVRDYVAGVFDGIFQVGDAESDESDDWPQGWSIGYEAALTPLATILQEKGYQEPASSAQRILDLMSSKFLAAQTEQAQARMAQLVKRIVDLCLSLAAEDKDSVAADKILYRYIALLEVIAGRSTYVSLLLQYPKVCEKVGAVLRTSAWAADYLTAHPIVLDELVDERVNVIDNFTPVDWSGWQDELWEQMREVEGDQESQMNILRDAHHGAVFKLLMADLEGWLTVERLADQLSALADAVIEMVISLAWQTIASRHCEVPRFAVVAYGKLGGKELSYASDLDLIYLYDDDSPEASKNYTRLVRRMMSWLTVQTSSGILFDVDLRLRPNGENGLVVSSFEMFKRYQRNEDGTGAWPWEHQALTRARFCAGDRRIGQAFEEERKTLLCMPRDKQKVFADVSEMRQKMLDGHPNPTRLFDVKHDRGGMVDVEFAVQAMVLAYSHDYPELVNNFGNILLLEMAGRIGLIEPDLAERCVRAYRDYRLIQRRHRLEHGSGAVRIPYEEAGERIEAVKALWRKVFGSDGPDRG
ncbi:MAG TPA: bifunctional [glutamate--ammonia ligase]-adenylyl-L-tyrosine phosphorylase/[glutamate--ammonia-ligase] adenylyltransferase [Candidatus Aphodousia gallistercoris]|nr:bifunctional [glutamate--ammonia ligase]-adenylyl-L-tyrosine phosphorylase/[glutamate--ammonia-ligase] adenylyltransferase [Candidatus Aphodousia gallistercoris]